MLPWYTMIVLMKKLKLNLVSLEDKERFVAIGRCFLSPLWRRRDSSVKLISNEQRDSYVKQSAYNRNILYTGKTFKARIGNGILVMSSSRHHA